MKDIDKLIQEAIEFGVKKWGSRQVMAIEIASHWLEGYMKAVTFTCLPQKTNNRLSKSKHLTMFNKLNPHHVVDFSYICSC